MYCKKCGREIENDAMFCPHCGDKIQSSGVTNQSVSPSVGESVTNQSMVQNDSEKGKNKKVWIIAGIALAVIIVVGIALKVFLGSGIVDKVIPLTECKDATITASSVADGKVFFVIQNETEKTIKDVTVSYLGFDANGNVINLDGDKDYETVEYTTINIMPGEVSTLGEYGYIGNRDVKYVEGVISKVVYADGSEWKTEGLDKWASETAKAFTVDEYKRGIEEYKSEALMAETNPYAEITSTRKYDDNRFSNSDDLDVNIKNIGDKPIQTIEIAVMEYDSNGYAINVSPYGSITENCEIATISSANLNAGEKAGWTYGLFFEGECKQYEVIITEIEFKDSTTWRNPYAMQWIVYNRNKR